MHKSIDLRIGASHTLYRDVSVLINKYFNSQGKKVPLLSYEEVDQVANNYLKAWIPIEEKVCVGMQEVMNLTFARSAYDVWVTPHVIPMSGPILIDTREEPDKAVDTITHELIHVLSRGNKESVNLQLIGRELFPDETEVTQDHILNHAVLEYIYREVHNQPSRLERDIEDCKQREEGYTRAWEIVQRAGYRQVIGKFKKEYPQGRP